MLACFLQTDGLRKRCLVLRIGWLNGQGTLKVFDREVEVMLFQGIAAVFLVLCGSPFPCQVEFLLQGRVKWRLLEGLTIRYGGFFPFAGG